MGFEEDENLEHFPGLARVDFRAFVVLFGDEGHHARPPATDVVAPQVLVLPRFVEFSFLSVQARRVTQLFLRAATVQLVS